MVVKQNKKNRIIPRYVFLSLKEDHEFNKLFANTIITSSGVAGDAIKKGGKKDDEGDAK